jgi:hypothetical protein
MRERGPLFIGEKRGIIPWISLTYSLKPPANALIVPT